MRWGVHPLRIQEVPGSNLGTMAGCTDVFGGYSQPVQVNGDGVTKLGHAISNSITIVIQSYRI